MRLIFIMYLTFNMKLIVRGEIEILSDLAFSRIIIGTKLLCFKLEEKRLLNKVIILVDLVGEEVLPVPKK